MADGSPGHPGLDEDKDARVWYIHGRIGGADRLVGAVRLARRILHILGPTFGRPGGLIPTMFTVGIPRSPVNAHDSRQMSEYFSLLPQARSPFYPRRPGYLWAEASRHAMTLAVLSEDDDSEVMLPSRKNINFQMKARIHDTIRAMLGALN